MILAKIRKLDHMSERKHTEINLAATVTILYTGVKKTLGRIQ